MGYLTNVREAEAGILADTPWQVSILIKTTAVVAVSSCCHALLTFRADAVECVHCDRTYAVPGAQEGNAISFTLSGRFAFFEGLIPAPYADPLTASLIASEVQQEVEALRIARRRARWGKQWHA